MKIEMQNLLNRKMLSLGSMDLSIRLFMPLTKGMEKNFPEFRQFKTSGTEYSLRHAKVQI